ncbi:Short-chain dehydrogenase [Parelusimicrobium proximum]|uniref:SDR family NAD(P)-dependent oxidoreductase n=1 Tax=Parelusimicrobium proximum TaxID=3228953 RepID=UPI003D1672EF
MKKILITGATSGIGRGLAEMYIKAGCKVAVTGRRKELLDSLKSLNPANVFVYQNDVQAAEAEKVVSAAAADMGGLDTVILCAGMGDINPGLKNDIELNTVRTNVLGFTDYAGSAYKYFKANSIKGTLAAVSSIASFRGSDSAPAYFASKAYVSNYLEGLRKKSFKERAGISVVTVIPGFVDTALAKDVGGQTPMWLAPLDKAVRQIYNAVEKRKKRVYVTKRWFVIAVLLKILPDFIYDRVL